MRYSAFPHKSRCTVFSSDAPNVHSCFPVERLRLNLAIKKRAFSKNRDKPYSRTNVPHPQFFETFNPNAPVRRPRPRAWQSAELGHRCRLSLSLSFLLFHFSHPNPLLPPPHCILRRMLDISEFVFAERGKGDKCSISHVSEPSKSQAFSLSFFFGPTCKTRPKHVSFPTSRQAPSLSTCFPSYDKKGTSLLPQSFIVVAVVGR